LYLKSQEVSWYFFSFSEGTFKMEDKEKSRDQLIEELAQLRRRIVELEASEDELKRAGKALQKSQEELEMRAKERTAELSKANTLLEQKIAERKQAVEELQKREKRFRDIAEHSFDWIWEVDTKGKYTYASPVVENILGYTPKEVLDKHFFDLFHPEDREKFKKAALEVFAKKQPFREFINRNVHKNGKTIWLSTSGVPILDEDETLLGYRGADSDITERKLSEERIEHLNLVLRAIRNVNQLITKEQDRDRLIRSVCCELVENRGYYNAWITLLDESGGCTATAEAGLGKDFLPMAEQIKRGNLPECGKKALRQSEVVAIEEKTSDCADCPLSHLPADSGRIAIRLEYGGKVYGLMNTSLPAHLVANKEECDLFEEVAGDIAFALYSIELKEERKQAEEQILKQSAVLNAINKVLLESLTTENEEELARMCLTLAEELTGSKFGFMCEVNERGRFNTIAISYTGWDACRIKEADRKKILNDMEIRGIRGRVINTEQSMIFNDPSSSPDWIEPPKGHPKVTCFLGVPLKHKGRLMGLIGLANSNTGYTADDQRCVEALSVAFFEALMRKRADEEIKEHRDHLEELVEERTRELRQTQEKLIASERLAVLGQFSGNVAHEIRNPLGVISSSAYFLKRIIKDDNEKVRTHLDQIQKQVVSCAKIIESILNLTRMKAPRLAPLNLLDLVLSEFVTIDVPAYISVKWDLPEHPIPILGDKAQLMLVFNNIIKNAVQVMPDGGTLTVGAEIVSEEEKSWAQIRFSDTGPGIEPANTDRIFQPLFTTKTQGIGFGLSIANLIVERHGGIIFVESKTGEGATFVIRLPVSLKNEGRRTDGQQKANSRSG